MRMPIDWLKKIAGSRRRDVLALLTPEAVRERNGLTRFVAAGVTVCGIMVAGIVGLAALTALLLAVAVIHLLATRVLGLQVNVDPNALVQEFYRQATARAANAN